SEQAKLEQVANYLLPNQTVNLIIEGHCDERGSVEYNRSLGERRAISVRDYLAKLGVPDTRMQTISYGEERSAVSGSDESAWAKNRRAELIPAR
ncbi:MAG: OmpA family protein, partial [Patescibacteria group bacterium]